jgi:23S rRNA (guanine745-N1)-methyltransferase
VVLETGAVTGYYLAGVLDRMPGARGLALDLSKHASRRAARAHERMAAIVCDVWRPLPVKSRSIAVVLDVFAPRNPTEFQRVLEPGGGLVIATPTSSHLQELVQALGLLTVDQRKPERLDEGLAGLFRPVGRSHHEEILRLTPAEVLALIAMGPSARHIAPDDLATRVSAMPAAMTAVTLSVTVSTYRRLP